MNEDEDVKEDEAKKQGIWKEADRDDGVNEPKEKNGREN